MREHCEANPELFEPCCITCNTPMEGCVENFDGSPPYTLCMGSGDCTNEYNECGEGTCNYESGLCEAEPTGPDHCEPGERGDGGYCECEMLRC